MKKANNILTLLVLILVAISSLEAQYTFTVEKDLPVLPARNQHRSGTCWSYATTSFLEAELIRTGKGEHELSEMYFVRKAYELKAQKYVRMHGETNFSNGGLAMDVLHILGESGMVPREIYRGLNAGDPLPVHWEMDAQLRTYIQGIIKNPNGQLSPAWMDGFRGILDAYLGEEPSEFKYGDVIYDAASFAEAMELDPDDYVAIGSYTHHPFHSAFPLEIPDNWLWSSIYNVPLDEMMEVLEHALQEGYTVAWDGDVGEMGYAHGAGLAMLPVVNADLLEEDRHAGWDILTDRQKRKQFFDFFPEPEEVPVDQEVRQQWFDNYQTTDIHLEHVCGLAHDQDGKRFYKVKNSYGSEGHIYNGFQFFSENFMRGKTVFILLHKDGIPRDIRNRLGL